MKICLIAPAPPPYGGIANWYILLTNHIKKDIDIDFININITPQKGDMNGRTLTQRIVQGVESIMTTSYKLKKIKKSQNIDVIHMTTSGRLAVFRDIILLKKAKKYKIPSVYHLHFGRAPEISRRNTFEWKLLKRACKLASCVVPIDKRTYDVLNSDTNLNVKMIANPFDISTIENLDSGLNKEKSIVFVGWVIKTKGIEELLEAWNILDNQLDGYKLKIVGAYQENYIKELKSRYSFNNVELVGELNHQDTLKEIKKACCMVLPSYTEGFPNVILEAMALKTAVIATDVGAIPEMIDESGIIIKKESIQDIIDGVLKIVADNTFRKQCEDRAYKKLINEYEMQVVYNKYKQLWLDL